MADENVNETDETETPADEAVDETVAEAPAEEQPAVEAEEAHTEYSEEDRTQFKVVEYERHGVAERQ